MKFSPTLILFTFAVVFAGQQPYAAAQVTVVADSFELADHPTSDRTVVTGGISGLRFFTRNATGASYSVSIVDDSGPGGLGSFVLNQTDATTLNGGNEIIGLFPQAITLASPGDFIRLQFTFRYLDVNTTSANVAGFRFGIEGSNGSMVTADSQTTVSDNDQGYYVQTGVGSGAPNNTNTIYRENGGTLPILGGVDRNVLTTSSGGIGINDILAHTASFTITRGTGTNMSFSLSYDGGTAITASTSTVPYYTFDEIAFGDGFVANPVDFNVDNISVVTNVPEPTSAMLGLLAVPMIVARRRRG